MATDRTHVCTLCNRAFAASEERPRCPHCLRRTGVVPAEDSGPQRPAPFALPGKRVLLTAAIAILLAAMGIVAWRVLPGMVREGEVDSLAGQCDEQGLPCPVADLEPFAEILPAGAEEAGIAGRITEAVARRGRIVQPDYAPDRLRPALEIVAARDLRLVPLEAVGYAFAAALAAGLDLAPCVPGIVDPPVPFWQRDYALCRADGTPVYRPLALAEGAADFGDGGWRRLTLEAFTGHFLAAAGELPVTGKEAYRLLGAAQRLAAEPDILFRLGVVKVRNGAPEFGIDDMRQALREGTAPGGQLALGDALLGSGLPGEALQAFDNLLQVRADDPGARLGKARALALLGRGGEAGPMLERLRSEDPELPGLWAALALSRRQQGDGEGAREAMRRELARNPAREYVEWLVDSLREEGRLDDALQAVEEIHGANPRPYLVLIAARLEGELGRTDAALARVRKGLENYPDSLPLQQVAARLLTDAGRYAEAEAGLVSLVERDPRNQHHQVYLAIARFGLEREGGRGRASARETVVALEKEWPSRLYAVATLLSQRGWTRECEALLEERLEGRKDDPLLTAWLYFFYRAHGKPDAARELKEARLPGLDGEARMQLERMLKGIDNHFAGQAREKNADGAEGEQQAPASSRRREQDD